MLCLFLAHHHIHCTKLGRIIGFYQIDILMNAINYLTLCRITCYRNYQMFSTPTATTWTSANVEEKRNAVTFSVNQQSSWCCHCNVLGRFAYSSYSTDCWSGCLSVMELCFVLFLCFTQPCFFFVSLRCHLADSACCCFALRVSPAPCRVPLIVAFVWSSLFSVAFVVCSQKYLLARTHNLGGTTDNDNNNNKMMIVVITSTHTKHR